MVQGKEAEFEVDSLDLSLVLSLDFLIRNLGIETKGSLTHWAAERWSLLLTLIPH